jgi:hypothetical protein
LQSDLQEAAREAPSDMKPLLVSPFRSPMGLKISRREQKVNEGIGRSMEVAILASNESRGN